jgi:hypothetical protein
MKNVFTATPASAEKNDVLLKRNKYQSPTFAKPRKPNPAKMISPGLSVRRNGLR